MAPWWLRSGNDEALHDDEAPGSRDDAVANTTVPLAAEDFAQTPVSSEAAGEDGEKIDEADTKAEADADAKADADADAETDVDAKAETDADAKAETEAPPPKKRRRRRRRRRKPAKKETAPAEPTQVPQPAPVAEGPLVEPETAPATPEQATEVDATSTFDMFRNLVYPLPDRSPAINDERKIAMFCDFENIALGVRDSQIKKLDINLILERLLEKGKIIVKKAYADWERYNDYKKPFHEAAIELIDIPQKYYSGKNSADIKMVVDAMDLCYSKEHLDTFVMVSGDSDFSPLVSKLKENNKYVIGVGVKNSSSNLLIDNCDEFIYYEDLWRDVQRASRLDNLSPKDAEVFGLMLDAMFALNRENKDVLWGSMIKQTMQRKRPSFNEGYYGYRTFSELLEDAQRKNIIRLKRDQRSGNYIVSDFTKSRG